MELNDIDKFTDRGWFEARDRNNRHWADEYRKRGSEATVSAGHALFEHARSIRPDFPTAADLQRDLDDLVRLKAVILTLPDAQPIR